MCVLLFEVFKHLLLRKTNILKTCRKSKFLAKENMKKCTSLEEQNGRRYIQENLYLALLSSAVFVYKTASQISFKLLCLGDKRLLSEFLRK